MKGPVKSGAGREMEASGGGLDANDAEDAAAERDRCDGPDGGDIREKTAALMARRAKAETDLGQLRWPWRM